MAAIDAQVSTGLAGLDRVFRGIMAGDNIVWQVDGIDDYVPLVEPFCQYARSRGRKLVYFHFARHPALVDEGPGVEVQVLDPGEGFEPFLTAIHKTIEQTGRGAYYVFDCLSDLVADWYSDQMLGNFFMLTCPYLYRLDTVAYFGLLRGRHSRLAVEPVRATTQLFLEVFGRGQTLYLLPIKTEFRHSPTIHLMLEWDGAERLSVVRSSAVLTQVMGRVLPKAERIETYGDDVVRRAEEIVRAGAARGAEAAELKRQLVGMMVTRDESILPLVDDYFTLEDLLDVRWRMVGTGLIGGKTVGMLLARKIAERERPELGAQLEEHDSFYIGSDMFYSFMVRNGLWKIRELQHSADTFLDGVDDDLHRHPAHAGHRSGDDGHDRDLARGRHARLGALVRRDSSGHPGRGHRRGPARLLVRLGCRCHRHAACLRRQGERHRWRAARGDHLAAQRDRAVRRQAAALDLPGRLPQHAVRHRHLQGGAHRGELLGGLWRHARAHRHRARPG